MRIAIVACALGFSVLIAGSLLGIANGETSTSPTAPAAGAPVRTVSVQGVASVPIAQNASASTANAVYRQGMAGAISDGQSKAQFLASQASATLGAIQNVTEDGGYIQCAAEVEYQGEMPDFGSAAGSSSAIGLSAPVPSVASRSLAGPRRPSPSRKKHQKRHSAKKASAAGCTLSAQVLLIYSLD